MRGNPFWLPAHKRFIGRVEFDLFLEKAGDEVKRCTAEYPRFEILRNAYSFTTSLGDADRLQLSFMKRKMGRNDLTGTPAIEHGAKLLYSLGDGGHVACLISGAYSELGRMQEKHIYLRIGRYTAHQLLKRLEGDIQDLVSYAYVSSLDTEPMLREKLRVWFLQRFHPTQKWDDDKFAPAEGNRWIGTAVGFTMKTMVMALIKPVAVAVALAMLIFLGFDKLAELIPH